MIDFIQQMPEQFDNWVYYSFGILFVLGWALALKSFAAGDSVFSTEPRREVPWGLIDVILLFGSMMVAKFIAQIVALFIIARKEGIGLDKVTESIALENSPILISCSLVFSSLQLILAFWYLNRIQRADATDLGWTKINWKQNVQVGLVAGFLIIPLVLATNILVHQFLKETYNHQVFEMVRHSILLTALSTVIMAPLVEEWHFRVFFQGFLERISGKSDDQQKNRLMHGDIRAERINQQVDKQAKEKGHPKDRPLQTIVPIWPLFLSAFVFAAMHSGQGAAPYALFVFAICLGLLYRSTHSVIPCLIVHGLLNLWSFVALICSQF